VWIEEARAARYFADSGFAATHFTDRRRRGPKAAPSSYPPARLANMTLGRTKSVDTLVSNPANGHLRAHLQRDCHHPAARVDSPGTTATSWILQHTIGNPDGLDCFSTSSSLHAPNQARASAACGWLQVQQGKLVRSTGISIHRRAAQQRVGQINNSTVAFFTAEFEITPEQFIHRGSELGHFNFQLTNLFTLLS